MHVLERISPCNAFSCHSRRRLGRHSLHGWSLLAQETDGISQQIRQAIAAIVRIAPAPLVEEISKWIDELSHDAFSVRQAAAERLCGGHAGPRALLRLPTDRTPKPALPPGDWSPSSIARDFNRRLEAFAADTDGRARPDAARLGTVSRAGRRRSGGAGLFVDMQRRKDRCSRPRLASATSRREQLWEERLMRLVQWQVTVGNRTVPLRLGSCAAMIFLGSVPRNRRFGQRRRCWSQISFSGRRFVKRFKPQVARRTPCAGWWSAGYCIARIETKSFSAAGWHLTSNLGWTKRCRWPLAWCHRRSAATRARQPVTERSCRC